MNGETDTIENVSQAHVLIPSVSPLKRGMCVQCVLQRCKSKATQGRAGQKAGSVESFHLLRAPDASLPRSSVVAAKIRGIRSGLARVHDNGVAPHRGPWERRESRQGRRKGLAGQGPRLSRPSRASCHTYRYPKSIEIQSWAFSVLTRFFLQPESRYITLLYTN
ncbi:uncharacterized protein BDZ83DRAFT_436446 [Colletotrichum acutatum]|uniref:Uncharacterized protein n=1 Tax=Glomerella acutata TaxID=27357 RepID=A0AAD8UG25_GLOAC|nr:uncharacterized protein BDZ83DRAFT_436446 [Colletotrichum acutatum]KAK1721486.1 hypothetical protein BDZ83DRAFT_436446 [Colletotrichum acutatum]